RGPPLRALHRTVDQADGSGILRNVLAQELQIAEDRHQKVVEVVSDPAGELADRLHLLSLAQQGFGALSLLYLNQHRTMGGLKFSRSFSYPRFEHLVQTMQVLLSRLAGCNVRSNTDNTG